MTIHPSPRTLLVPALALALGACNPGSGVTGAPPARTVTIQAGNSGGGPNKALTLSLGDTVRIVYAVADVFNRPLGTRPTFISRDSRVVSVSVNGLIRALGAGTTYVTAFVPTTGSLFAGDSIRVSVNVVCTLEARAGIVIGVQDSLTGSRGPFTNVSYVARDTATFRDSTLIASVPAQVSGSPFLVGLAYERAGKFEVTVRATGYRAWVKPGVVVTKDACHVTPVSLTARLVVP